MLGEADWLTQDRGTALQAAAGAEVITPALTQHGWERYFSGSAGGGGMVTLSVSIRIFHELPSRSIGG